MTHNSATSMMLDSTNRNAAGFGLKTGTSNWRMSANLETFGTTFTVINQRTGNEYIKLQDTTQFNRKIWLLGKVVVMSTLDVGTLDSIAGTENVCRHSGTLAVCSSSIRYEKDVQTFSRGLELLKQLTPATFRWKVDDKEDVGFVAEEVAGTEPLLTTTNKNGETEGVKYDRITTVLVNSVKEQQLQIEAQQKQIGDLKAILCSIKPDAADCVQKQ